MWKFFVFVFLSLSTGCKLLRTQQSAPQITNGTVADARVSRQGVIRIRSIFTESGSTMASICTGTIIHLPNQVLNECAAISAAHCFANVPQGTKHSVEFVSPEGKVLAEGEPSAINVHPSFRVSGNRVSEAMSAVDLAVLRFPCGNISSLQASKILDYRKVSAGTDLIVAGYGLTLSEAQAAVNVGRGLQGAAVQPRESAVLMQTQMKLREVRFPERPAAGVFALAGTEGRSSCNGDSGGPAFFDSGKQLYLVASTSAGPAQCEKATAVYAITSVHAEWINSALGGQIVKIEDSAGEAPRAGSGNSPVVAETPESAVAPEPTAVPAAVPAAEHASQPAGTLCAWTVLKVKAVTRSWGTIIKLIDKDSTQISEPSFKCNLKNETQICLSESLKPTTTGNSTSILAEAVSADGCEKFTKGRRVYIYRPDFRPAD